VVVSADSVLQPVGDCVVDSRYDSFDHNVFNLLPYQGGVDALGAEILPQGLQSPENTR